ncbi:MAG: oligosaccharide repeat unit polymerase [Zoogloea sp.]|uniref:oligosaccharide repeat unit polymerase n=1 Tax=Zoogloea sp. TaxID=49181 RepID=UPI00260AC8FF|nr:oligosaccharide repeat unit polymerase [Zoogloea sp.]MDD3326650.1 oligosaccharide repeat unit polymerase [Zoogloea sp.]
MLFLPERLAIAGILTYSFLFLLAPLDLVFSVSWGALTYILFSYSAFFLGCLMATKRKKMVSLRGSVIAKFPVREFWFFMLAGSVGMAIRIYDKYVNRGAGVGESALDVREMLAETSAGPLASLGAVLYPFCYIPLIILWARPRARESKIAKWSATLLFISPAIDSLLLLSRSQLLVALAMMYFAIACVVYKGKFFPRPLVVPVLIGITAVTTISVVAFLTRLDQMQMDLAFSIMNSVYGYTITPNELAWEVMREGDSFIGPVFASLLPILQYYLHGLFEFFLLWGRPDGQMFGYGAQHLAPYIKALTIFGLAPETPYESLYYRPGVFTTFFGTLWMDFGWFGPLFMLAFGFLCKRVAELAREGMLAVLPLHSYLCVVVFFMPVVSFLISAQGTYVVNTFLLFFLWRRFLKYS